MSELCEGKNKEETTQNLDHYFVRTTKFYSIQTDFSTILCPIVRSQDGPKVRMNARLGSLHAYKLPNPAAWDRRCTTSSVFELCYKQEAAALS